MSKMSNDAEDDEVKTKKKQLKRKKLQSLCNIKIKQAKERKRENNLITTVIRTNKLAYFFFLFL